MVAPTPGSTRDRRCYAPGPLLGPSHREVRTREVVVARGGGLEVHQKTVVAGLVSPGPDGQPVKQARAFGTMTDDRRGLAAWLSGAGCTVVAMEGRGAAWQPIGDRLADHFAPLLVNARQVTAVPGRQTDVKDCAWLAGQAAGRTRTSDLGALDRRLAARRGKQPAAVGVGQAILAISYQLLTAAEPDRDLGADSRDRRAPEAAERRWGRGLERRRSKVSRDPAA